MLHKKNHHHIRDYTVFLYKHINVTICLSLDSDYMERHSSSCELAVAVETLTGLDDST